MGSVCLPIICPRNSNNEISAAVKVLKEIFLYVPSLFCLVKRLDQFAIFYQAGWIAPSKRRPRAPVTLGRLPGWPSSICAASQAKPIASR